MNNSLISLFEQKMSEPLVNISEITAAGSNRQYFRLHGNKNTVVGVQGTSVEENRAFAAIAKHLYSKGLSVPKLIALSDDGMCYLQEDLGDVSLFGYVAEGRKTGVFSEQEKEMLRKTMAELPNIQINGAADFDFSVCYPQPAFDRRTVLWDLNYFKYCFLKLSGIDFLESKLEDDFEKFADILLNEKTPTRLQQAFMYRDFQSRNVMLKDEKPYFIDFQGGRKGAVYYDVASFLWQARANYSHELKEELLQVYLAALKKIVDFEEAEFRQNLNQFILFRTLQVLGAYGFRGYFEKKPHFLQSIPLAIENLRTILKEIPCDDYPYLATTLHQLTELKQFADSAVRKPLLVVVYSFSYKKGIPADNSGNGGGFVFDCRAVNNPGKYERYTQVTGLDESVIRFLEDEGEILSFLNNAQKLVEASVKRYKERGFTHLSVAFGCTGGQHRSVYSAQKTAEHINQKFGVKVQLIHRELNIEQVFEGKE